MKVLITGAAGRLGRKLTPALQTTHELVLGDLTALDDPRYVPLDITDLQAVRAAVAGCEALVHLVILDWQPCSPAETLRFGPVTIEVHVAGLHNVLQAAWEQGVQRFVYVSSASVVDGLPPGTFVGPDCRHYSNSLYGLTKGFGEDLCRMFHHSFDLPVTTLRLGTIYNPEGEGYWLGNIYHPAGEHSPPEPGSSRVHVEDVTDAIAAALQPDVPDYTLAHIVGADSGAGWDLSAARERLHWQPRYGFCAQGEPYLKEQ